ncbi:translocation and assembly module lipoprotein TamL [Membranihabitans maritimus]|uniref:translocation and assembly module lipoprotein TamL n=1 Tax=Membranihabitans maritimus TaxID=2904244 RepID=UPI001F02B9B3|nr:BamA/TamA family outer membrane protein [Membranihabitans maritimus]
MRNLKIPIFAVCLLALLISSCNVTKFIGEDEYLLTDYQIEVEGPIPTRDQKILESEIYYLDSLQQIEKQNWRIWLYYKYRDADTGTIKNFIYRQAASTPNIYKTGAGIGVTDIITRYLMEKGYYDATTRFAETLRKRKASISYDINTGPLYTIASKEIIFPNPEIQELISSFDNESHIKIGDVLSFNAYEKERNRISSIMQNNGYPYFTPLNISKRPEAVKLDTEVDVKIEIQEGTDSTTLKKYFFGDIVVNHNFDPLQFHAVSDTATIDGIQHLNFDSGKSLDKQVMSSIIPFRRGSVFDAGELEEARQNILRYNIYSSVLIQRIPSPVNPNILNIYFILTPSKKYEFNVNFDFNNTEFSSRSLLGISLSPEISNRNFFGKGENLTSGLEFVSEFNPWDRDNNIFQTFILGLRNNLSIPRFVDFLGTYKLLKKPFPEFYETLESNGLSSINLDYDYVLIDSFYTYHSFEFQLGNNFNWAAGRNSLRINTLGINVFFPELGPDFNDRYEFIRRSMEPQLFTGLVFNNALFTHVSQKDYARRQYTFNGNFEVSGLEMMLANYAINQFQDTIRLFDRFEFAKFVKLDLDGRFSKDLSATTSFASRLNVGIALPLPGSETIPFIKQFFLGGPSSMRAWRIRELGPGSLVDSVVLNQESNIPYAQVGDLKLEMNAEYRFPLFWRLNSAVFLDVGNIWSLDNMTKPEAQFGADFWKEMAIGTGTGLRIDLTFFILRLDLGIKLKLPYRRENGSYWAFSKFSDYLTQSNLNLAISMPF